MVAKGILEPDDLLPACSRRGHAWLEGTEMDAERPEPGPAWQNGGKRISGSAGLATTPPSVVGVVENPNIYFCYFRVFRISKKTIIIPARIACLLLRETPQLWWVSVLYILEEK